MENRLLIVVSFCRWYWKLTDTYPRADKEIFLEHAITFHSIIFNFGITHPFPNFNDCPLKSRWSNNVCASKISAWMSNHAPVKCGTKLLHSQTSTAAPSKFGYRYVISSHTLYACNYLSMLRFKFIRVDKKGPWQKCSNQSNFGVDK